MNKLIQQTRRVILLLLFLLFIVGPTYSQTEFISDLNTYVGRAIQDWKIPGLAIAIVKDGSTLLTKGYGVREFGKEAKVDEHTLFGIASNTKAFTTAALAILVDEGKIDWDDAVIEHLPGFQMYDPYVTREMTIRDLLTHRSGLGLGAGDLLFWPKTTYTRKEIIYRLRFIKPASSFRSKYAYDNILYLAAGEIIPAVTGKSWANFLKERIFTPLGMTSSNTSVREFLPGGNVVTPHVLVDGKLQPVSYMNIKNAAPAGAINSCVSDMAKWLIVQLDSGLVRHPSNGKSRLFSSAQTKEMWSAETIIPIGDYPSPISSLKPNFSAYGLGWGLTDYHGYKLVSHGGVLLGMVSRVTMVPAQKLGIVVLTNQEASEACQAISYYILDHYLGLSSTDWISKFKEVERLREERIAKIEKAHKTARVKNTNPSLDLSKYTGKYIDKWYGQMSIEPKGKKLVMRFSHSPYLVGDMEHWHYDTFVVRWHDRSLKADAYVTFSLNYEGCIKQVKMIPVSPQTDFSFDFQDLVFKPVNEKK